MGNDYYHFDPTRHWLMGERTNRIYRLGDQLDVRVVQVNLDERKIDFELAEKTPGKKAGKKTRKKTGKKAGKTAGKKTPGKKSRKKRKTGLRRKTR
jgi:ribonuclease R